MAGRTVAAVALLAALVAAAPEASRQAERRYTVRGMVLRVDTPSLRFFVSHERVEGLMEAMTMPFEVRDASQLQGIVPGTLVDFELVITKQTGYATNLRVRHYETAVPDPLPARRLLRGAAAPVPAPVALGERVPDFTLTDSTGQRVKLSSFAGKVVAINFVYTRCALPQFCLRMTNTFGVAQKRFAGVLGRDAQLLSVTFDPERDTPEVLAVYARQWSADPRGWQFLTGSVDEVRRVCGLFGMDALPGDSLLTHMVRTVIVGRDGRLLANSEGNQFTPEQFGDLLRSALEP